MTDTTRPQERDFSEMLTKDNAALVMIDHQAGLMLFPGDIDPSALRMNAVRGRTGNRFPILPFKTVLATFTAHGSCMRINPLRLFGTLFSLLFIPR